MESYKITKTISNNMVRANDRNGAPVILTGRGIGFQKTHGDLISSGGVENIFVLKSAQEAKLYDDLAGNVSPFLMEIANEAVCYIQSCFSKPLNDHIHVALADHLNFVIRRYKMGIPIDNPFSYETDIMYPEETKVASHVLKMINKKLNLNIPESEASFIAMHIISSLSEKTLSHIQKSNQLIEKIVSVMEQDMNMKIDRTSLNYARFLTHLRFMIERVSRGEHLDIPEEMNVLLQKQYPVCYNSAFKLSRIAEQELRQSIAPSEVTCLSIHLYRFLSNDNQTPA